jgi:hypothetical protein
MRNKFLSTSDSTQGRSKTMRTSARAIAIAFAAGACFAPLGAHAFDSGSTGADGPFNPTVNTTVPLPPSGIFNFTSVNIPSGVTVRFQRNATNTPVVILATGDVVIAGSLNVSGASAPGVANTGDGSIGDDGTPGAGGPGGFDGGRGGLGSTANPSSGSVSVPTNKAGAGLGPGGGAGGFSFISNWPCVTARSEMKGGIGGGFGSGSSGFTRSYTCGSYVQSPVPGGAGYGTSALLPLIGGSGGGGGSGGESGPGAGGGGGGGAILIAASGTVNITGSLLAVGGSGGSSNLESPAWGAAGGGGSGGAIRIVATTIAGNGAINASGGAAGTLSGNCCSSDQATAGAPGRVRLETENYLRNAATTPTHSPGTPAPVFVAGTPTLRIASVAGVPAPATPTGNADITLPSTTANPVTVVFETSGVPVGNTVRLTVTPAYGDRASAITPALTGSTSSATASVSVNLPVGPSVLSAQTTYTVVAAVGDLLKNFAGNERVEKVTLMATLGGPSKAKLITVSGKEYEVPADVLRIAALGG